MSPASPAPGPADRPGDGTADRPGADSQPQGPARTRIPVAPIAVAGVATAVAIGAWFATRDGEDPAAAPAPPAATAPAGTTQEPAVSGEAPERGAGTAPAPPAASAAPEADAAGTAAPDAAAPEIAPPGTPATINGAEVTPPAGADLALPTGDEPSWAAPLEERGADGPYALGYPDAPVVMLMYSEFQCPYCRSFSTETMPQLMPCVEDGTLRVMWRDFPYLGPESSLAALGGRTAAEQDMFWEFHDALFALGVSPNSGAITEESLADLAEEAGLDRAAFEAGLNTIEQQEEMLLDQDEGLALGVVGTPSFIVNGMPIRGAQPAELFIRAIEDAAAARGAG